MTSLHLLAKLMKSQLLKDVFIYKSLHFQIFDLLVLGNNENKTNIYSNSCIFRSIKEKKWNNLNLRKQNGMMQL